MQLKRHYQLRQRARGLTLIELMIALVAGLVVTGAAVALVVSTMKANAETIRGTRLTQELRSTAEVAARELRRARSVTDPIANVGLASASMVKSCNTLSPASGTSTSCATFSYDCTKDAAGNVTGVFKALGSANGKVRLVSATGAIPACPTGTTGTQLSSDNITITTFTIAADATYPDKYTISVAGKFSNDPTGLVRTISQEVRIRSTAVN